MTIPEFALEDAKNSFAHMARQIAEDAMSIAARMERLKHECQCAIKGEPYSINNLGEIQQLGQRLDLNCARLEERRNHMNILSQIVNKS